jgi:hypothetical protein
MLDGILSGKTRVLDLAYAINDKLVPCPADERWFEAKVNSSVEKDGCREEAQISVKISTCTNVLDN